MAQFNFLDVIFVIIAVLSVIFGVIKGFVRELFSLAFFILAVVLAFLYYAEIGRSVASTVNNRDVANFAGFVLILVVVLVVGALVTHFMKKLIVVGPLKSVDRSLGALFGMVRGGLICTILVFGLIAFQANERLLAGSFLAPMLMKPIGALLYVFPESFQDQFNRLNSHGGQENSATGRTV